MMVTRPLSPALARSIRMLRRVVHFAADRSLQHAGIDECRRRMPMGGRSAARPVLDQHCTQTFAGNVRQLVLVDEGHLGVLRLIREDAAERQGGDKPRTEKEDVSWSPPSLGWLTLGGIILVSTRVEIEAG